ncbi:histidine phosphatase family protein [Treponema sp.]|uniref:histidine phosphatase family protein n=1 Tax=Treponema sp. TaxID=166 RepID=UPI0025F27EFE|nr:histidine phosphatase family protein [Treponema sp.]MCR5217316.1 histidine phosphatase family protein [Treponema sp.]
MHLIFVRHGDPDYANDNVTQKGRRELELLAERSKNWKVDEVYVSPMGRAAATAEACLKNWNVKPQTVSWLREFNYPLTDKDGNKRIAWDWLPRDYFSEKKYADVNKWWSTKIMKSGNILGHYNEVCNGIDNILSCYDYSRISPSMPVYNCFPHMTAEEAAVDTHLLPEQKDLDNKNIVFFCHLGVMFAILSHLTGISPVQLWQGFFVAPSSVTIAGAEERIPGEVAWRIQTMGDTSHLRAGNENMSASGFYGSCLSY